MTQSQTSFKRNILAVLILPLLFFVGSCGFQPLYSNNNIYNNVAIKPIEGRLGYLVESELKRKLGSQNQGTSLNTLEIKIVKSFRNANLRQDSYTTRTQILANVTYIFTYNNKVLNGNFTALSGFDAVDKAYSEVSLTADSEERLSKEIAERIWREILINTRQ